MIQISKEEVQLLESKGYKWGEHIHSSHSKHKKYYATEMRDIINVINKHRKNMICEGM